ncbi:MAG: two component transcriptional regulator, winged helix family [Chthoniobacteraceae bacterium]|nr:two component transcriptional regulator, winged helix family [Chthoniobacteraceae bacterium]
MKPRVLIADDEPDVLALVGLNLSRAGFHVITAADGDAALARVLEQPPSLAILDLMMPGMTGLEICRIMRATPATALVPIVMLTAKSAEMERIVAFELGVDDYVTKPFSPRELVLRVSAILRKTAAMEDKPPIMQAGSITLDSQRHEVTVNNQPVDLTVTEFKLLSAMLSARGRMQARETLLTAVWGDEAEVEPRTIDTHLRRLREKLGPAGAQIHTVRGFGYRLNADC